MKWLKEACKSIWATEGVLKNASEDKTVMVSKLNFLMHDFKALCIEDNTDFDLLASRALKLSGESGEVAGHFSYDPKTHNTANIKRFIEESWLTMSELVSLTGEIGTAAELCWMSGLMLGIGEASLPASSPPPPSPPPSLPFPPVWLVVD